jgi:N-acetylglucosamine-6-sulfatase
MICAAAAFVLIAHAGSPAFATTHDRGQQAGRPNIVVVVTDDQTASSFTHRTMPETRRLMNTSGTRFTEYVVTTPTCCPSRATMLTGQYAHNHGVLSNGVGYSLLREKANVLPLWLRRAGYRTAHVGKFLNGYQRAAASPTAVAPGWTDWYTLLDYRYYGYALSVDGDRVEFGSRSKDYLTRVLNREAVGLVERYSRGRKPFYLALDQFAPHKGGGSSCAKAPEPDPKDLDRFQDTPLPRPPSFDEQDIADKPSFIRDQPTLGPARRKLIRSRYRCRLASLRAVDRGVKKIVATLRAEHELDDTIIIFASDNGFFTGEHRLPAGKSLPYEEALRNPLAIRVPARFRAGPPVPRVDELTANIDIAPTILDFARAEPCRRGSCRTLDGRSLTPLLSAETAGSEQPRRQSLGWLRGESSWPQSRGIAVEYGRGFLADNEFGACQYAGIRTAAAVFVRYNEFGDCPGGEERELYDLDGDPFQLQNLADDPAWEGEREALEAELARFRDCAGISGRDPLPPSGHFCD